MTIQNAMTKIDNSKSVWYAKYNPFTINDMILPSKMKSKIQEYVTKQNILHLGLFSNVGGLGKSALCHAIIKEMGGEALWVNASIDRGIDVMRGRIKKFASQQSFDDNKKVVIMDEFDNFSADGQAAFRGFIDEFGSNCCFIFTGNHKEKIIEPLLTRLEVYDFAEFPKKEMVKPVFFRLEYILKNEEVEYQQKDIVTIINTYYPSIRSMIGAIQKFTMDGVLTINEDDLDVQNAYSGIVDLMKPDTYFDMVQEVNKLASPNNLYSYLYKNADTFFKMQNYPKIIILLAKYEFESLNSRDKHLQLVACLSQIMPLK